MCGICGFWAADASQFDPGVTIGTMVGRLRHRGPDDCGRYVGTDPAGAGVVALGHARLSIIDLGGGHQPIANETESAWIICNGEIYNFAELRAELEARGHRFRTNSDTEVILHLWEDEGPACVERLRGMFAFAIWDQRQRTLFVARDRFGQKPLFMSHGADGLAFASEIKGVLPFPGIDTTLDPVALDAFLFYQYVPHPRTMFTGIRQLPPGSRAVYDGAALTIDRYWQPPFHEPNADDDTTQIARVEDALRDAVGSHLVSDVPVGVFLSGGIDSSLIAAFAAEASRESVHSFSIAFPGSAEDESRFARAASEHVGTIHHEFAYEPHHVAERLDDLARIYDQPLADRAALPLAYLSECAARETKVVLTGDGGDELFGGYGKYAPATAPPGWVERLDGCAPSFFSPRALATCGPDMLGLRKARARLASKRLPIQVCVYAKSFWEAWDRHALYGDDLREQLTEDFEGLDDRIAGRDDLTRLNRMLLADQLAYLPDDLLPKTDYATMASSLEARAPLLDHHLADVAGRLPDHLKTTPSETKIVLRRIAQRHLPAELVVRKKKGFSVPLKEWFRGELQPWVRECLLDSSSTVPRYFRPEAVRRVIDEHASGRKNRAAKIYALLFFELWHRHYL